MILLRAQISQFLFVLIFALGCTTNDDSFIVDTTRKDDRDNDSDTGSGSSGQTGGTNSSAWLINTSFVVNGGPGKDGIPTLDQPEFTTINGEGLSYLSNDERVTVVKINDEVFGFAHPIMDWHEIANVTLNNQPITVTYCPLTGTSAAWSRIINDVTTTFGVSGLLYQSNILPYDRGSNSIWSQMLNKAVNGPQIGLEPINYPVIETTWQSFKQMFPNGKVTSSNTGYDRDYNLYPYLDYREDDWLLFPVEHDDGRLPRKERVLAIIHNDQAKVYRFSDLDQHAIVNDQAFGDEIFVFGSSNRDFIGVFFKRELHGEMLDFQLIENDSAVLEDQFGNKWDVFGKCITGPDINQQLEAPYAYVGYWFAIATFFPSPEIFGE